MPKTWTCWDTADRSMYTHCPVHCPMKLLNICTCTWGFCTWDDGHGHSLAKNQGTWNLQPQTSITTCDYLHSTLVSLWRAGDAILSVNCSKWNIPYGYSNQFGLRVCFPFAWQATIDMDNWNILRARVILQALWPGCHL
jgi:hypothetical protein